MVRKRFSSFIQLGSGAFEVTENITVLSLFSEGESEDFEEEEDEDEEDVVAGEDDDDDDSGDDEVTLL